MTSPLDRRADPLATPAMTEDDVETVRAWVARAFGAGDIDYPVLQGFATLLHEIDRAWAAEKRAKDKLTERGHSDV